MNVLILSSSMGAGHDGAGRELIARLEAQGHRARMHDYLDALPLGIGHFIRWNYQLQLRYAPWSYENSYHMWPRIYGLLVFLNARLARRRLKHWMRAFPPDVVLSNNPLATLAIGRLRQRGKLRVPAVTFITDFGVHPLWVHRGIDLHLTVHQLAATEAAARSGGEARAPGPLVGERFRSLLPDRRFARATLGLSDHERAVLVVAGSWGVGEVEETARLLQRSGRFTPVTVCGRDLRLRQRMEAQGLGVVIGWTDDMPTLMSAADALVENAGGLTSMEAFAAGLPVVTFNPIPGHGRDNAAAMERAGVTRWPSTVDELLGVLDEVTADGPARQALVDAAGAMFCGDAAADVLALAASPVAQEHADVIPIEMAPSRRRRVVRRVVVAGVASAAVYGTLTAGVAVAADYGLTVPSSAHPQRQITLAGVRRPVTYLGVRVSAVALADPSVQNAVAQLRATVIVTGRSAATEAGAVRTLAAEGVDVATGGWGTARTAVLPEQRDLSSARMITDATGIKPSCFVPSRPVDALDLLWASRRHVSIVVPQHTIFPSRLPAELEPGESYVLDARAATPDEVVAALGALNTTAQQSGMVLSGLKAFE
jgi:processive 1,2-diacylglycerol beta-glucosyltransferase